MVNESVSRNYVVQKRIKSRPWMDGIVNDVCGVPANCMISAMRDSIGRCSFSHVMIAVPTCCRIDYCSMGVIIPL